MRRQPIAHTPPKPDGKPHDLEEHLLGVGTRAGASAAAFGAALWGDAAGRWHDLGKFNVAMQDYLYDCMAAQQRGQKAKKRRIDHSIAGAQHAVAQWGNGLGELLAFIIAGHHAGLTDYPYAAAGGPNTGPASLGARLKDTSHLRAALAGGPSDNILQIPCPPIPETISNVSLFARMIFSSLIDADRR